MKIRTPNIRILHHGYLLLHRQMDGKCTSMPRAGSAGDELTIYPGADLLPDRLRRSAVWHAVEAEHERHPRQEPLVLQPSAVLHSRIFLPPTTVPTGVAVPLVQAGP